MSGILGYSVISSRHCRSQNPLCPHHLDNSEQTSVMIRCFSCWFQTYRPRLDD